MKHRLLLLLACVAVAAHADDQPPPRKKLIATGWDKVDQDRLKEHVRQMEEQPFSGIMMDVMGTRDDGKRFSLRNVQQATPWKRAWFADALETLKAVEFRRFTDNFVSIGANPGNVDWFDDQGWENVTEHWAIAAWLAQESGFRGFLFDPEPYHKPYAQFRHRAQAGRDEHAFEEYYAKARERGRQVMSAVVKEYPDLTIYCYFMNSVVRQAAGARDPMGVLRGHSYGLLPAFIDGWLDVVPPEVIFVDGCESAYRFNSELQYLRSAVAIKGDCSHLVSPENRAKYRAQVQVSYGIYLDAYWNPPDTKWSRWMIDCGDRKPVEQLLTNVRHAVQCCDQYVWIYGEKFRWWPTPNRRVFRQTWPEALPNCDLALRLASDPLACAAHLLRVAEAEGTLENLARNGDFESATAADNTGKQADWKQGGAPAGWSCWQLQNDEGTFTWDRETGTAKATGIPESGCFIQSYVVKPGENYAVRANVKTAGNSQAWIRIRWQTAEGKWTHEPLDVTVTPSQPDAEGWRTLFGAAMVPESTGRLVLLLGMGNQTSPTDAVWFDSVEVVLTAFRDMFSADRVRCDLEQ